MASATSPLGRAWPPLPPLARARCACARLWGGRLGSRWWSPPLCGRWVQGGPCMRAGGRGRGKGQGSRGHTGLPPSMPQCPPILPPHRTHPHTTHAGRADQPERGGGGGEGVARGAHRAPHRPPAVPALWVGGWVWGDGGSGEGGGGARNERGSLADPAQPRLTARRLPPAHVGTLPPFSPHAEGQNTRLKWACCRAQSCSRRAPPSPACSITLACLPALLPRPLRPLAPPPHPLSPTHHPPHTPTPTRARRRQGDAAAEATQRGAHVRIEGSARLEGVESYRMGQLNQKGEARVRARAGGWVAGWLVGAPPALPACRYFLPAGLRARGAPPPPLTHTHPAPTRAPVHPPHHPTRLLPFPLAHGRRRHQSLRHRLLGAPLLLPLLHAARHLQPAAQGEVGRGRTRARAAQRLHAVNERGGGGGGGGAGGRSAPTPPPTRTRGAPPHMRAGQCGV